jgi:hypothetical protein
MYREAELGIWNVKIDLGTTSTVGIMWFVNVD